MCAPQLENESSDVHLQVGATVGGAGEENAGEVILGEEVEPLQHVLEKLGEFRRIGGIERLATVAVSAMSPLRRVGRGSSGAK